MGELAQTRQRTADALDGALTVGNQGVRVYAHRPNVAKAGDGWLVLRQVEPSTFATCMATFDLVLALSQEEGEAQRRLDELAVDLVDVIGAKAGATPVTVTPQITTVDGTDLYCAVATFLIES